MSSWKDIQNTFIENLSLFYNKEECKSLFFIAIESLFKRSRIDYALNKNEQLSEQEKKHINKVLEKLKTQEPIQYILSQAYFRALEFYVDKNVLIPRSETEELIDLIAAQYTEKAIDILDIGTGSGCIAISLKKECPLAKVKALDVSEKALSIAKKNAEQLQANISFFCLDILNRSLWSSFKNNSLDIIVSNPPYVCEEEKQQMKANVLQYEPDQALFVENNNPLLFYDAIASFAQQKLKKEGYLFFEINERYGNAIVILLKNKHFYNIRIIKDIHDKERFIEAQFL